MAPGGRKGGPTDKSKQCKTSISGHWWKVEGVMDHSSGSPLCPVNIAKQIVFPSSWPEPGLAKSNGNWHAVPYWATLIEVRGHSSDLLLKPLYAVLTSTLQLNTNWPLSVDMFWCGHWEKFIIPSHNFFSCVVIKNLPGIGLVKKWYKSKSSLSLFPVYFSLSDI